jgi:hypothetical protein
MANTPLVGGVVTKLNNVPLATTVKVSFRRTRNVTQKYGPLGPIGSAPGQYKFEGTLDLAAPLAGLEIDIDTLSANPLGFSLQFSKGAFRYLVTGCHIADDGFDNDPLMAETNNQVRIVATEMIRIA